ncbi:NAD(P)H-binding protein [Sphingomonas sp. JC676]|uniref:NmrA family NAD(P)-binding protein n=1 Tax=Sphingomonas sp. JC676 TaxID=2768065 RepID=UPI001657E294|nr:NAD(P)H-binding protein [Sphingomonas sp. JC676]MBC9031599.1 NAD(P)H-binding protein [Sphingomonas sp. JC676]
MYAITGITGQVGGAVARTLLAAGKLVRAVARDPAKAADWIEQGCSFTRADMDDSAALTAAFSGAEAVFILLPPVFDPSPDFREARAVIAAVRSALLEAKPDRVVCLSTIGADSARPNLLNQLRLMEQELRTLPMPVAFLRACWFMENASWDIAPARENGVIPSFLQPLDGAIPMIATDDVGSTAAALLQRNWQGEHVVELQGPALVSPLDIAATLGAILRKPVRAEAVPREEWEGMFRARGMSNPLPRMQMLDGVNQGWIAFGAPGAERLRGSTTLEQALRKLVERPTC